MSATSYRRQASESALRAGANLQDQTLYALRRQWQSTYTYRQAPAQREPFVGSPRNSTA